MTMRAASSAAAPQVIAKRAVAVAAPADTNENILATITIPPLGANSAVRITWAYSVNNNANNKISRARLSGIGGTVLYTITHTTVAHGGMCLLVSNRNATNSQAVEVVAAHSGGTALNSTAVFSTAAIDTSVATSLVLTGQKAVAGDTIQLESYMVELVA